MRRVDCYHKFKSTINTQKATQSVPSPEWAEPKVVASFASSTYSVQNPFRTDSGDISGDTKGTSSVPALVRLKRRRLDIADKLYLAPLTTNGNMPFRRICVEMGAEITCSEMAWTRSLLTGRRGEWSLCRRHESEKIFGIQLAGGFMDRLCKTTELMHHHLPFDVDFIDLLSGPCLEVVHVWKCYLF